MRSPPSAARLSVPIVQDRGGKDERPTNRHSHQLEITGSLLMFTELAIGPVYFQGTKQGTQITEKPVTIAVIPYIISTWMKQQKKV
jgi:hypothetical protein